MGNKLSESFEWVLAFDGTCQACGRISAAVESASGGILRVMPLAHPDVVGWRTQAMGADAGHTPTLLRISSSPLEVRAWTGLRMASKMARLLGVRNTFEVFRALATLRREVAQFVKDPSVPAAEGMGRRKFFQVGSGAALTLGFMVAGSAPGWADPIAVWMKENKSTLPSNYKELAAVPELYRQAVYNTWTPEQMSAAWLEHLQRNDDQAVTDGQRWVMNEMVQLAGAVQTFEGDAPAYLAEVGERATAEYGLKQAIALFGRLGDEDVPGNEAQAAAASLNCNCSFESDWCELWYTCQRVTCTRASKGCGWLHNYSCVGKCPAT